MAVLVEEQARHGAQAGGPDGRLRVDGHPRAGGRPVQVDGELGVDEEPLADVERCGGANNVGVTLNNTVFVGNATRPVTFASAGAGVWMSLVGGVGILDSRIVAVIGSKGGTIEP